MAFTHIDCFSGPGGICTGLHAAGFETKVAIEYIESCVDTYKANHPEVHVIHSDIRKVEKEQILRINELARKKKAEGLSEEELKEQAELRAQYLREFRANMEETLKMVRVEQEDGTYKPLVKKEQVRH